METKTIAEKIEDNAATFAVTMFYRSQTEMHEDVLDQDGNVILLSRNKRQGLHTTWRVLYDALTKNDTDVLITTPNPAAAHGSILSIEDEIERSPFEQSLFDFERTTDSSIQFGNGSRITAKAIGGTVSNAPANIRGHAPDLLVINDWTEEGHRIPESTKSDVLAPMLEVGEADLWLNARDVQDDALFEWAFDNGVYVERTDR